MTAYVGLFLYAGPWAGTGGGSHRNVIVAILLAVFASRGSRVARALMITYSVIGVLAMLIGSTSWWSTQAPALRFEYFVCYLLQICLLVSTPMYERTRPGWSPHRFPPTQFLPAPRIWMVLASTTIGLIITLLPLAGLQSVVPGQPARCACSALSSPGDRVSGCVPFWRRDPPAARRQRSVAERAGASRNTGARARSRLGYVELERSACALPRVAEYAP